MRNRGNREGVFRLRLETGSEPANLSEERKPGRAHARGKTEELMVNNRAAIPDRASLRRCAKSSPQAGNGIIGSRSSAESASLNRVAPLPEGRAAVRLVQPRLDLQRGQVMGYQKAAPPQQHCTTGITTTGGFEAS